MSYGSTLAPSREPAPAHVPKELVHDEFEFVHGFIPNKDEDPFAQTAQLFAPGVPPLMYTTSPGARGQGHGQWMVTHHEDITKVYQDAETFSTDGLINFQFLVGESWQAIPISIDPPDHMKYRTMLNPYFSPKAIDRMEASMRANANALIDAFIEKGECNFMKEFAFLFPVRIFLNLMGLPISQFQNFLDWEFLILHNTDPAKKAIGAKNAITYLRQFIAEKKANPTDDLTSHIVTAQIGGRPITDDEIMGTVFFLWIGGLDTVAATLALTFRRLALNPDLQKKIVENPQIIPEAVEEFLRIHPLVNSTRLAKKDIVIHGTTIKKGDWVTCLNVAGNFDEREFPNPYEIRFDRPVNRHFSLAGGPHRCLGSHLARRELRIALGEWFRRIPSFRLKPGVDMTVYPGLQSAPSLQLVWDR